MKQGKDDLQVIIKAKHMQPLEIARVLYLTLTHR